MGMTTAGRPRPDRNARLSSLLAARVRSVPGGAVSGSREPSNPVATETSVFSAEKRGEEKGRK